MARQSQFVEDGMRHLVMTLILCVSSPLIAADGGKKTKIPVEEQKLLDKWIVRSVKLDGKPTAAQIGQKIGDVITIKGKDHKFYLS